MCHKSLLTRHWRVPQSRAQADSLREQQRSLEAQLARTLADLELNKLEACNMMHEAVALINQAQRRGETLVRIDTKCTNCAAIAEL